MSHSKASEFIDDEAIEGSESEPESTVSEEPMTVAKKRGRKPKSTASSKKAKTTGGLKFDILEDDEKAKGPNVLNLCKKGNYKN